jgi:AAA family ATP:ADP antiporter
MAERSESGNEVAEPRGVAGRLLSVFNLRPAEIVPVLLAAVMFFCILFGYSLIRPVREAFGVERGMGELPSLFIATMVASFALNPVFSWLVGRFDRRVFLPVAYGSIVLMLLGFAAFRAVGGDEAISIWTGRVFFVWLSVINVFMVGLFWSLMSDCFGPGQSRRVFPSVAVGGTFGAVLGSASAWAVSGGTFELLGRDYGKIGLTLDPPAMMVVTSLFVGLAGAISVGLSVLGTRGHGAASKTASDGPTPVRRSGLREAVDGFWLAVRSRYLLAIAAYIGLMAVLMTVLYFKQAETVLEARASESGRVGAFASIDFWAQITTLVFQLVVTAKLIRWIGIGWALVLLPMMVVTGCAILALGEQSGWAAATLLGIITVVQAVFRAGRYAIARPAREMLFTVLERDEKYKAKSLIDTFVYRAGDVAGVGLRAGVATLSVGALSAMAATVAPIAIVMAGLALWLGSEQARRAKAEA